ncbi:Pentatricopeptide_repeat_domain/PPR_repeat/PPR_repeat_family [Leishmania braziliensis MHOM/BR/75/M2904]|uniref:Pentatricopeptide_repeat_domain/PPR_repeat/PPR_re peat_family n=1 Tax=Leishmania braziliensis MHOM/BR/75/M2904 TaxID=420245 RepID=A0A3P3ZEF8_LEIBR|nr:Pentatricopeptide_repeat_domain/PPR_repeat/PPR_repeat_family [Leishmania braziliensis MHOM/BR/75/M2904]
MYLTKRPPAELIIRRPNGTEDRFVQPTAAVVEQAACTATNDDHDATYQVVMECAPYTASFNALLAKQSVHEDSRQLVALVHHRMHSEGIPLNTQTYNLLMKRVVRFTDGAIFTLYDEIKNEGLKENSSVRPDMGTYMLLFRACERSALYNRTFVFYQQLREQFRLVPETAVYNTLLGYCAAVRDVAQATFLVEEMKQLNVPRDVNTYNCLMSVMVESAPYAETLKVFQELLSLNLRPSNRSYNTILKAASRHSDYDRAFQLVEEMKKKGLIPDMETYNYLISVCEQRIDYVRGTSVYSAKRSTREQILQGSHAIAELVMTLLREMRSMQVCPDTYTYNKALSILLRCEDERVFVVYNDMVRHANEIVDHSSSVGRATSGSSRGLGIARGSVNEPNRTDAGKLLEDALQAEDEEEVGNIRSTAVRPNRETWRQMIKACSFYHHFTLAKEVSADMRRSGVTLSASLGLLLLEVCCAARDVRWAEDLLAELKVRGVLIDTPLMNAFLSVLCAADAGEVVFTEYEQMRMGIHPTSAWADTDTCNIVLRYAYTKPCKATFAENLCTMMAQPYSTTAANEETFCIRLEALTDKMNVPMESVIAYVEDVVHNCDALTTAFYHSVLQFFLVRDDARIQAWFDRLSTEHGNASSASASAADVQCYTTLMQYYLSHAQYDMVKQLFHKIQCSSALEANAECYHVLCEVARRQGDVAAVKRAFDQARVSCVVLDVHCYNSILMTLVEHTDAFVYDVLSDMQKNRVSPAESTMAVFIADAHGRQVLAEVMSRALFYTPPPPIVLEKMRALGDE